MNTRHIRTPALRAVARTLLGPVTARRRLARTSQTVRFPAWQYLTLLRAGHLDYEPEIAAHLERHLRPGDVVIDVGANIGLHTLRAAHLVGAAGRVHAFEPDPQSSRYLIANLAANGLKQVTPWAVAVGGQDGVAELFLDLLTARTTSLNAGHKAPSDKQTRPKIMVPVKRLDDLVAGPVRFMKIDAEGFEVEVLNGARRIIDEQRPTIVVESTSDNLAEVLGVLSQYGYEVFDAERGGPPNGSNLLAVQRA